jgi:hypothetical protein
MRNQRNTQQPLGNRRFQICTLQYLVGLALHVMYIQVVEDFNLQTGEVKVKLSTVP